MDCPKEKEKLKAHEVSLSKKKELWIPICQSLNQRLKNMYTFLGYSILESKNLKNLHCASDACVGFNYSWLILVKVDFKPKEFKA